MIADRRDFRLARDVRPSRYDLHFDLDVDQWTSLGREHLTLMLDNSQSEITLHAVDLDITSVQIAGGPAFQRVSYEAESQTATRRFASCGFIICSLPVLRAIAVSDVAALPF